jgi:hypothetical protein
VSQAPSLSEVTGTALDLCFGGLRVVSQFCDDVTEQKRLGILLFNDFINI